MGFFSEFFYAVKNYGNVNKYAYRDINKQR